jgi:hypothetical protein
MTILRKTTLTSLLLGSCLFGGVVSLQAADHRSDCEKHIRKAEDNLYKEIRKHGEHSRQAADRRRELEQARYGCRDVANHGYYGRYPDRYRYNDRDRDRDRYYDRNRDNYYRRDRYYYDRDRDYYYRRY